MTITYREARDDEAGAIAELHARSWRSAYRGMLPDAYLDDEVFDDRARVWAKRFTDRTGTLTIVGEDGGRLVGLAHSIIDDDAEWGTLLDNLHADPVVKRRGIGRRLLRDTARQLPALATSTGLHLWCLEANVAAQAFYEAMGGVVTGTGASDDGTQPSRRYWWKDAAVLA